jgi:hypothetical protein
MRRLGPVIYVMFALAAAGRADELASARNQTITALSHTVEIRVNDGVATYRVQRAFQGGGPALDEAQLDVYLPSGGAITGFRVRAGGRWRDGALVKEPEPAETMGDRPGPALALWINSGESNLHFPVASGETTVVEYTITAPTRYEKGAWLLSYTEPGEPAPVITVVNAGAHVQAGDPFQITVPAGSIDTLTARFGRVIASPKHAFARLEVDVAKELRPLPKQAQVVFVVDASYSVKDKGVDHQLAIARAILQHIPDASFAIVPYRRFAGAVIGFQPAARFDEVVAAARASGSFELGNGSALEAGVAAAAQALAKRPGPHRMILFTDELLRPAFEAKLAIHALPGDAIAHVVVPKGEGRASVYRDDGSPLAPVAAATKGMMVDVTVGEGLDDQTLRLVRPTEIHGFRISGAKIETGEWVDEGEGLRFALAVDQAPTSVALDGLVWGAPFHRVVPATAGFSAASAAFVFGENQFVNLDEAEQMTVAQAGRAVSPVTSYVIAEGKRKPSPQLVNRSDEPGVGGKGVRGIGAGVGHRNESPLPPDLQPIADPLGAACIAEQHPPAGWAVTIDVDTTLDEVVDVRAQGAAAASPTAKCIVEKLWAVRAA